MATRRCGRRHRHTHDLFQALSGGCASLLLGAARGRLLLDTAGGLVDERLRRHTNFLLHTRHFVGHPCQQGRVLLPCSITGARSRPNRLLAVLVACISGPGLD